MHATSPTTRKLPILSLFTDRSFRVITLITLIAVMSLVDLYLTILYITHTGMNEINPIARAMMEYHSPAVLGLWKIATVVLSVGILAIIRKKRTAEVGAWIGCIVLTLLMTHWVKFIDEHARLTEQPFAIDAMGQPDWVYIQTDLVGPGTRIP